MSSGLLKGIESKDIVVIREIYDSENALETFGDELERALEAGCKFIVVEPSSLGDETGRWISVGNCLHKTAVISGLGAIVCSLTWGEIPWSYASLSACSLFCTGLYTVSWQFDPCSKYQVCQDAKELAGLPRISSFTSASPVILVRKNDNKRKALHLSVTLLATVISAYRFYSLVNK